MRAVIGAAIAAIPYIEAAVLIHSRGAFIPILTIRVEDVLNTLEASCTGQSGAQPKR